jgi:uncharacterized membrane protein YgcG
MAFLHLFIINKSGGLIYHRELSELAPIIDVNILLSIGSTFHSLCSIAVEACPVKKKALGLGVGSSASSGAGSGNGGSGSGGATEDGIEVIEGEGIILCCYQTRTGVKFVITAEPGTRGLKKTLKEIYVLYADCTLKDPFYELEMPIRCELFTQAVDELTQRLDSKSSMNHGSGGGMGSSGVGGRNGGGGSSGGGNNRGDDVSILKLR